MDYDPSLTSGKIIFQHFNDPQVKNIVNAWINEILLGLSSIVHIFNPSCLILGGGVMAQPYITERLQRLLPAFIMPSFAHTRLLPARLGNFAGLLGAGRLAEEKLKSL